MSPLIRLSLRLGSVVIYSEASRFTSARTNRELDTVLEDAQAQRVAAGGGR